MLSGKDGDGERKPKATRVRFEDWRRASAAPPAGLHRSSSIGVIPKPPPPAPLELPQPHPSRRTKAVLPMAPKPPVCASPQRRAMASDYDIRDEGIEYDGVNGRQVYLRIHKKKLPGLGAQPLQSSSGALPQRSTLCRQPHGFHTMSTLMVRTLEHENIAVDHLTLVNSLIETDSEAALPSRIQVEEWVRAFNHEVQQYKSVVVVSDLMLDRAEQLVQGMRQPHLLTIAPAVAVLHRMIPLMHPYEDVLNTILEELQYALYCAPLAGCVGSVEALRRRPHVDQFFNVAVGLQRHKERNDQFKLRLERQQRVLDRTILNWVVGYARKALRAWNALTARNKQLRARYKKVFVRLASTNSVNSTLRQWKQYAHRMHHQSVENTAQHLQQQLAAAVQLRRHLEIRRAELYKEKDDLSKVKGQLSDELKLERRSLGEKSAALETLMHQKQAVSLTWEVVMTSLFSDIHVAEGVDLAANTWIVEMLAKGGHSFRATRGSAGFAHPPTLLKLMGRMSSVGSVVEKRVSTGLILSGMEQAQGVCDAFWELTRGQVPPMITPHDILRHDQSRAQLFIATLQLLYAGGHCGAFSITNSGSYNETIRDKRGSMAMRKRSSAAVSSAANTAPPSRSGSISHSPAEELSLSTDQQASVLGDSGRQSNNNSVNRRRESDTYLQHDTMVAAHQEASMINDWRVSKRDVQRSHDTAESYFNDTLQEALSFGEELQAHQEAQKLYDRFLAALITPSAPLLISALSKTFGTHLAEDVVDSFFHEEGAITDGNQFAAFVVGVAQAVTTEVSEVLVALESELTPSADFLDQYRHGDVQVVLTLHDKYLRSLFVLCVQGSSGAARKALTESRRSLGSNNSLDLEGSTDLSALQSMDTGTFADKFDDVAAATFGWMNFYKASRRFQLEVLLDEDLVHELYSEVCSATGGASFDEMCILLCALASIHEPNVFLPLASRVDAFLRLMFGIREAL